jgi:hypothetical protein
MRSPMKLDDILIGGRTRSPGSCAPNQPEPDGARIGRLMRRYIYAVASQGVMQVAIILVMARFVTGL